MFPNVCKFDEFRRIMKQFYHIFQDFGLLDLRTTEPFRSDLRTFFSNLRTFGLKNLRTHEPSNLRTFGLMRCNPIHKTHSGAATFSLNKLAQRDETDQHFTFFITELEFAWAYLCCRPKCRLLLTPSPASTVGPTVSPRFGVFVLSQSIGVVCASIAETFRQPTLASVFVGFSVPFFS